MQVLHTVVTSGSVSAAAVALGYTPSAISQQVRALEKQAGIALLERIGRGIKPTMAGRLLARHAAVIEQQVAEAEAALADLRNARTGRLSIRYFATAGATLVAPALARLRQDRPDVQIDLKMTDPDDPLPDVMQGRADLAIVVRPHCQVHEGIRLTHLLDDPYRVVLPLGHPLASQPVLKLSDLAGERWIGSERPGLCLDAMLEGFSAAGFRPEFEVETEDYTTAQAFVAAGVGATLIPNMGLAGRHPAVVVRELSGPEPVRAIHAAVRETSLGQPALRELLTTLREVAKP
ncbi:DNA-binding transcriptional regulator, LysR family [Nonomuraea jiangxiensis]|uniref:DNA-binding transcriptional regulator, LysR family n=2 Tax=Nonomuraea jiangxiensis TaxID=633440 RepID=A0A1G9IC93_9ACTN|nr:DNA-binding transcriptional regulator, LysR family [Nonomuraea jiangxiensis]